MSSSKEPVLPVTSVEPITCCNCVEPVGPVHIECAECTKEKVDLCLKCFSCGAECGTHIKGHNYRVKCTGGVTIFTGSTNDFESATSSKEENDTKWCHVWCSNEEIALLETVEKYNLGNWEDVAPTVNPQRSVREVKEHYDRYYLRGRLGRIASRGFHRPPVQDHTDGMNQSDSITSPPIRQSVTKISADDLRLLAYMPLRDDFEKEWRNDAEELVSKLLLMPDDDDLDKSVKLAQIDMYIRTVRERRKLKSLARDYDLVPSFFKQEKPGISVKAWQYSPAQYSQMKTERELRDQYKKFAQFMSSEDYDQLMSGLHKEKLLKQRIEELQKYRKNGVTTLEEGESYTQLQTERTEQEQVSPSKTNTQENASSSWKLQSGGNAARKDSVSVITIKEPITDGTVSDVGRKNWPSQTDDKSGLLSNNEIKWCKEHNVNVCDFLMVKMSVLKEHVQKMQGVPQRTNIRDDTVQCKLNVKEMMKNSGWIPLFS